MKTCSICSHPDRAAIDAALVAGDSLRVIEAGHAGTTRSALDRHRKHLAPALTQAKQAEAVADATTLLSRVERLMSRCEGLFESASKDRKWAGAAAAARELRGCLELVGRLSGELQSKVSNSTNVNLFGGFERPADMLACLSDEQLKEFWERSIPDVPYPEVLGYGTSVFDEESIPPFDLALQRRLREEDRQRDIADGKQPSWKPGVTPHVEGQKKMLAVAWKRLTDCELPRDLDLPNFRGAVQIEVDFDMEGGYIWPRASLRIYHTKESTAAKAAPAKTIQGVR